MLGLVIVHQSRNALITMMVAGIFLGIILGFSGLSKNQFLSLSNPIMILVFVITVILVFHFNQEEKEKRKKLTTSSSKKSL